MYLLVTWCRVLDYMVGVLDYMVGVLDYMVGGLDYIVGELVYMVRSVEIHGGERWGIWWSVWVIGGYCWIT